MPATWYQIRCDVPCQLCDTVADYLADLTGCGVCTENRAVDSFSECDIPALATASITCYLPCPCPIEKHLAGITAFLAALPDLPAPVIPDVTLLGEEDWASSWKIHFKPLAIGQRLLIIPTWEVPPPATNRAIIILDPGMAFGTGSHQTTRLCLECLETLITDAAHPVSRVLDLGTGSGILAIAAAKLGVTDIDAVDIDPQAVTVATENCSLNSVSNAICCSTTPLENLADGYQIILANILAEELVRMAPAIIARLAPGGSLILSGILAEREQLVRDGYSSQPVVFVASHAAEEWRCLHYRRLP